MPSTQPGSSTIRGWSIACAARMSRRDWKNSPPRTRSGADSLIVAAAARAVVSGGALAEAVEQRREHHEPEQREHGSAHPQAADRARRLLREGGEGVGHGAPR